MDMNTAFDPEVNNTARGGGGLRRGGAPERWWTGCEAGECTGKVWQKT